MTVDRGEAVLRFRYRESALLREYRRLAADVERWNRLNPKKKPIAIDPIPLAVKLLAERDPNAQESR